MEILTQPIVEAPAGTPVPMALKLRLLTHGQAVLSTDILQGVKRPTLLDRPALEEHTTYQDLVVHCLPWAIQVRPTNLQALLLALFTACRLEALEHRLSDQEALMAFHLVKVDHALRRHHSLLVSVVITIAAQAKLAMHRRVRLQLAKLRRRHKGQAIQAYLHPRAVHLVVEVPSPVRSVRRLRPANIPIWVPLHKQVP